MSSAKQIEAVPSRQPLYFVNGVVDVLFVGGISILAFAGLRLFGPAEPNDAFYRVGIWMMWLVNWPHFAASTFRLYESRDNIRQYPWTSLVVPWVIIAGATAALVAPLKFAPYLVMLYSIWSPYHFSGQTLGVSMIYARRGGYRIGRWQRFALSSFIYGTFIATAIRNEIGDHAPEPFFGIPYPSFGLPEWRLPGREPYLLVDLANLWMYAGGAVFVGIVVYRWIWRGERPPLIVLVPAVAQYFWFAQGIWWESFLYFVPFFHSLQYMYIAWAVRLKGRLDRTQVVPSRRFVVMESLRWAVLVFVGGGVLFYGLPQLADSLSLAAATGVIWASVQIHHFFVDGVIWKLRTKSVSSPLMFNLDQMIHEPAPAEPVPVGAG